MAGGAKTGGGGQGKGEVCIEKAPGLGGLGALGAWVVLCS